MKHKLSIFTLTAKIRGFIRNNWGSPFIVGFIGLLMGAAGFLAMGFVDLSNMAAVSAYGALVAGVVLQFACFLKFRDESEDEGFE